MASDMKSLTAVLINVKDATRPHLYHEFKTTPMNTVASDGPSVMNLVFMSPRSSKITNTNVSQHMRNTTMIRLSSNTMSIMLIHMFETFIPGYQDKYLDG